MNRYQLQKYLPYTILMIAFISINPYFKFRITITVFWWLLEVIILYMFYAVTPYLIKDKNKFTKTTSLVYVYIFYNLINIIRGLFVAEIYWDYKALFNNGLALMLPLVTFACMNLNFTRILLSFYMKYVLALLILLFPFITYGAVGFYMVPISFFAVFLLIIDGKWKYIILALSFFVVFLDFGARSNVIKFIVPLLFSLLYFFRKIISKNTIEVFRNLMFILPFILFVLAIVGELNVFNMNEYLEGDFTQEKTSKITGETIEENLTADTRTVLYVEVLATAEKYNTWIFGRSPARGNETEAFGSLLTSITGRNERSGNEVAILNIFTWTGGVGVLLYFLVFYHASYLAVNKSNNFFSKILGLYLAFRWCYAWAEDINYFTMTTYMLWLTIGLTLSPSFRKMNNYEVKLWLNSIFTKRMELKYKAYRGLKQPL